MADIDPLATAVDWDDDDDMQPYPPPSQRGDTANEEDAISLGGDEDDLQGLKDYHEQTWSASAEPLISIPTTTEIPQHTNGANSSTQPNTPREREPNYQQANEQVRTPLTTPAMHALPPKPVLASFSKQPSTDKVTMSAISMAPTKDQRSNADTRDLPHPWQVRVSSGKEIYYFNTKTGESTWEKPTWPSRDYNGHDPIRRRDSSPRSTRIDSRPGIHNRRSMSPRRSPRRQRSYSPPRNRERRRSQSRTRDPLARNERRGRSRSLDNSSVAYSRNRPLSPRRERNGSPPRLPTRMLEESSKRGRRTISPPSHRISNPHSNARSPRDYNNSRDSTRPRERTVREFPTALPPLPTQPSLRRSRDRENDTPEMEKENKRRKLNAEDPGFRRQAGGDTYVPSYKDDPHHQPVARESRQLERKNIRAGDSYVPAPSPPRHTSERDLVRRDSYNRYNASAVPSSGVYQDSGREKRRNVEETRQENGPISDGTKRNRAPLPPQSVALQQSARHQGPPRDARTSNGNNAPTGPRAHRQGRQSDNHIEDRRGNVASERPPIPHLDDRSSQQPIADFRSRPPPANIRDSYMEDRSEHSSGHNDRPRRPSPPRTSSYKNGYEQTPSEFPSSFQTRGRPSRPREDHIPSESGGGSARTPVPSSNSVPITARRPRQDGSPEGTIPNVVKNDRRDPDIKSSMDTQPVRSKQSRFGPPLQMSSTQVDQQAQSFQGDVRIHDSSHDKVFQESERRSPPTTLSSVQDTSLKRNDGVRINRNYTRQAAPSVNVDMAQELNNSSIQSQIPKSVDENDKDQEKSGPLAAGPVKIRRQSTRDVDSKQLAPTNQKQQNRDHSKASLLERLGGTSSNREPFPGDHGPRPETPNGDEPRREGPQRRRGGGGRQNRRGHYH